MSANPKLMDMPFEIAERKKARTSSKVALNIRNAKVAAKGQSPPPGEVEA
jgi:hypothetical protein